jgi:hypothetical protein
MIEVFQQTKAQNLCDVRVRLILRQTGRHLDRHLLITDGRFQRRLIGGIEPVHDRLLVLLDTPDLGQRNLQVLVHPRARMPEAHRFRFDAIHQNDPHRVNASSFSLLIGF